MQTRQTVGEKLTKIHGFKTVYSSYRKTFRNTFLIGTVWKSVIHMCQRNGAKPKVAFQHKLGYRGIPMPDAVVNLYVQFRIVKIAFKHSFYTSCELRRKCGRQVF